jgi:hypothetical protein
MPSMRATTCEKDFFFTLHNACFCNDTKACNFPFPIFDRILLLIWGSDGVKHAHFHACIARERGADSQNFDSVVKREESIPWNVDFIIPP